MISGLDRSLLAYALVTAAYWAFMLTDGALRMSALHAAASLPLSGHSLGLQAGQMGRGSVEDPAMLGG